MADISKIKLPNGTTYNVKDSSALHSVPKASSTTLGGVKVGSGLDVDSNGVLSTTSRNAHLGTWYIAGVLGTTGRASFFGNATLHFFGDGTFTGEYACQHGYAGASTSNFEWGIDSNAVKTFVNGKTSTDGARASLSSLTPVTGGTITPFYNTQYFCSAAFGSGGCFEGRESGWWLPSRIYTQDGAIGGWAEADWGSHPVTYSSGTFIGKWKGTVNGYTVS